MKIAKIVILVSLLLSATYAVAAPDVEMTRFHQVGPRLYRGAQPTAEGFAKLRDMGVRIIINLRTDDSERQLVESLGMQYVHIPIPMPLLQRPWKRIPDEALRQFLQAVQDAEQQPVFVHCQRGADRTGAMVALYRVGVQGWDAEKAYSEARQIGMRWWYRAFKKQIVEYESAGPPRAAPQFR
jgi:protein tyrosine/serine phosphatase